MKNNMVPSGRLPWVRAADCRLDRFPAIDKRFELVAHVIAFGDAHSCAVLSHLVTTIHDQVGDYAFAG